MQTYNELNAGPGLIVNEQRDHAKKSVAGAGVFGTISLAFLASSAGVELKSFNHDLASELAITGGAFLVSAIVCFLLFKYFQNKAETILKVPGKNNNEGVDLEDSGNFDLK